MDSQIPATEIYEVEYFLADDENHMNDSTIQVTTGELFKMLKPVPEGVYDPHMGTTDFDYICAYCNNEKGICPGHPGSIKLNYPVKDPLYKDDLLKWLKIICHNCGNCIMADVPKKNAMNEVSKKIKRITHCMRCNFPVRKVEKDKNIGYIFNITKQVSESKFEVVELNNFQIQKILNRITDKTLKIFNRKKTSHPKKYIRTVIRVPPTTTRPDMKKVGGGKSNINDTTALFKQLVSINNNISLDSNSLTDDDYQIMHTLELIVNTIIKAPPTSGEQQRIITNSSKMPTSVSQHFSGKEGYYRRLILGKRVMHICRSVISTDPRIRIEEVGVPISIASRLQVMEIVTPFNFERMQTYFLNARDAYPGCTHVIMGEQKKRISINRIPKGYKLRVGDTIYRDLIDGDPVLLNRQPSLSTSSIGAHFVKIVPTGLTLRLNVSACNAYNADFDGDQMHMIVCQDPQTRAEIQYMSHIGTHMISFQTAAPIFGNYYDSLIGISLLTQSDTILGKKQAMELFSNIELKNKDLVFDKEKYTGRELFSMILPDINYPEKSPSFYMPQYSQFIKYDPDDIKVRISRGKLESGIIDKATAGQGEKGSIYHVIHNDYGMDVALETIFNAHQMANNFLYMHGFTSGIADINISEAAANRIKEKIGKTIADSMAVTNKLNNGTLIVPKGSEIRDYYEREQLAVLDPGDDFIHPIFADINFYNNGLASLIFRKSKGKPSNFISINGAIGSQVVGDKRPLPKLGGRSNAYSQRFEDNPIAWGYVIDSWRAGIRPESYLFSCAESKHGLINNATSTCVAGTQMRVLMKNTDSIIVDNSRKSMKFNNVIQIIYSETGLDPRKNEKVKIQTVMISDKEIEVYRSKPADFDKQFQNAELSKLLDEEYKQILADRDKYREIFMDIEKYNLGKIIFDNAVDLPVNPYRIIDDVIYRHRDLKGKKINPLIAIPKIRAFIADLGYVHFNEDYAAQKKYIPEVIKSSMVILEIAIRSYLNMYVLQKNEVNDPLLDIILTKIYNTMKKALIHGGLAVGVIASQALSEPLTQFVLDSKNKSGGLNREEVSMLVRIKEIYSAKTTADMKGPYMVIRVNEEYEMEKARVQQIASYVKMMTFDSFTTLEQIFEEKIGEPVHPKYTHEKDWIKNYIKYHDNPPSNLVRWCARFEISRDSLFVNSIKLDKIIFELMRKFPEIYFVHTPETHSKIIVRAYFSATIFKNVQLSLKSVKVVLDKINKCVIRGVDGIINTEVSELIKSYVDDSGAVKNKKIYVIQTTGSNLSKILENPYIDRYATQTNSITEFEEIFGIDAARNKIIAELMSLMDGSLYSNCALIADEMTFSGTVTGIQKSGLAVREKENVPLRLSFQSPLEVLKTAGIENAKTQLTGISGPIVLGQMSKVGTTYNDVILNRDFIQREALFKEEHTAELI